MTDKQYWIWLQLALGQGARFLPILEEFETPEALYHANILVWRMSPTLTARQIEGMRSATLSDAQQVIAQCEENGWNIITFEDEDYPARLKTIANPPAVLYVDGDLLCLDAFAVIGIVGTRKASGYAVKAATIMSKGMARCGAVIVSGGALGVDSAAHRGAIEAGGRTYAILGCGFGTDYLRTNEFLRDQIKESGGALLTEYPPFVPASKTTFPMRNRLISGLSDGVLVVEAGVKSGSLITASHAAEQGRDIFAIPASIFDKNFQGSNQLIEDGAYVAISPESVLLHYKSRYDTLDLSALKTPYELLSESRGEAANASTPKQVDFDAVMQDRAERIQMTRQTLSLGGDEKTVYHALNEELQGIEDIIQKSGIPARNVLVALTMLEMKGLIQSASGKRYRLKG